MIHTEGKLLKENGASVNCSMSGSAELLAFEYAVITKQLLNDKKGRPFLKEQQIF